MIERSDCTVIPANEDGWTDWQQPVRKGYRMQCCDCGLVHVMDFRVYRGRAQFRCRRETASPSPRMQGDVK